MLRTKNSVTLRSVKTTDIYTGRRSAASAASEKLAQGYLINAHLMLPTGLLLPKIWCALDAVNGPACPGLTPKLPGFFAICVMVSYFEISTCCTKMFKPRSYIGMEIALEQNFSNTLFEFNKSFASAV